MKVFSVVALMAACIALVGLWFVGGQSAWLTLLSVASVLTVASLSTAPKPRR